MTSHFRILIAILYIFVQEAHADYLANQDTEIIGKKLWVYYDKDSCRDDFKIYPSRSNNDAFVFSTPVEVLITELNKTPLNWYAGAWYELTVKDGSASKGYIVYDDMNANHGYTKNLYFSDSTNVDLVLLQNACISNLSPQDKLSILNKSDKAQLDREAVIHTQEVQQKMERDRLKLEQDQRKALDLQVAIDAENLLNKNEENEKARLDKERLSIRLKDASENIKKLTEDEFCDYYGNFIRGKDLAGFGTAEEMKLVIKKEAQRRKIRVNEALIKQEKIKLGISTCELYASWGEADSKNRSVGSYGVHIQHIYGSYGSYVYTENGRVTSWQD